MALCAAMLSIGGFAWTLGGFNPFGLVFPYIGASLTACMASAAVFALIEVAKLARAKADDPLKTIWAKLKPKLPILAIPAFVLPIFLSAYTAVKSSLPLLVGYRFDELLANADALIFGTDPWQYTHAVIGPFATQIIEMIYVPIWIALLAYTKAMVALFADRKLVLTFYTASMLSWILGGVLVAYILTSAGPTFTDLNGLEMRFAEIKMSLLNLSGTSSPFISGPAYLDEAMIEGELYRGGGISAMPSMHIAACTLYCLVARGTRWLVPALAYLAVIFVGSIHSGYHYAVDAPVAVLVAWLCWRLSERLYDGAVVLK